MQRIRAMFVLHVPGKAEPRQGFRHGRESYPAVHACSRPVPLAGPATEFNVTACQSPPLAAQGRHPGLVQPATVKSPHPSPPQSRGWEGPFLAGCPSTFLHRSLLAHMTHLGYPVSGIKKPRMALSPRRWIQRRRARNVQGAPRSGAGNSAAGQGEEPGTDGAIGQLRVSPKGEPAGARVLIFFKRQGAQRRAPCHRIASPSWMGG